MNLYELTVAAAQSISTYRHPDISDWLEAIDPVLIAAYKGSIANDTVEDITLSDTTLYIRTSYSVMGCPDTNSIELPLAIIKADDPVQAAKLYKLDTDIENMVSKVKYDRKQYDTSVATLDQLVSTRLAFLVSINKDTHVQPY